METIDDSKYSKKYSKKTFSINYPDMLKSPALKL